MSLRKDLTLSLRNGAPSCNFVLIDTGNPLVLEPLCIIFGPTGKCQCLSSSDLDPCLAKIERANPLREDWPFAVLKTLTTKDELDLICFPSPDTEPGQAST
jgi:hypothetical protein